jgi:3-oxoadipate enol-lactonase
MLVQLDSLRLNVVDEGDGQVLLMLHGLGATHRNWEAQVDLYRGEFRCVAPDLRGAGLSDRPPGPYSLEEMTDDVAELCDRLGVTGARVLGQSMGGMIAQALAVRRPDLVEALVLVATTSQDLLGDEPPTTLGPLESAVRSEGLAALPDMVRDAVYPRAFQERHPERIWHFERDLLSFDEEALIAAMRRTCSTDFAAELPKVGVPALVVAGHHDQVFPLEEVRRLAGLLPRAEFVVLPDCGHQPQFEDPEAFDTVLRLFLATLPSAGIDPDVPAGGGR